MNAQSLTIKQGNAFLLPVQNAIPLDNSLNNGNVHVVVVGIIVNQQNSTAEASTQASSLLLNGKPAQTQLNRNLLPPPQAPNQTHPRNSRQSPKEIIPTGQVIEDTSQVARNGGPASHVPQAAHGICQNCQNPSKDKVNRPETTNIEPYPNTRPENKTAPLPKAAVRETHSQKDYEHPRTHEGGNTLRRGTAHTASQQRPKVSPGTINRPAAPAKNPAGPAREESSESGFQKLFHGFLGAVQADPSHKPTGQSSATKTDARNSRNNALGGGRRPLAVNQRTQNSNHVVDDRASAFSRSTPQNSNQVMYNNSLAPAKISTGPGNAPRNAGGHSAPIVQASKDRHENAPRQEQKGFVDDQRMHPALNGSTDGAEQHVPQGQKLLNPAEIRGCFEALNRELGREPKFLKGSPARIAILGGALATEHLKRGAGTSVIEVLIDPRTTDKDRLAYIRDCMRRVKVFREFDRPDGTKAKHEWFFEKKQFRNDMFKGSLRNERFPGHHHLDVYAVAATDAFEIEMRRLKTPGQNEETALANAVSLLGGLTGCGVNPKERNWCRNLCQVKKRAPIPPESIEKVANRFFDHYKKDGNVGNYH